MTAKARYKKFRRYAICNSGLRCSCSPPPKRRKQLHRNDAKERAEAARLEQSHQDAIDDLGEPYDRYWQRYSDDDNQRDIEWTWWYDWLETQSVGV